MGILEVDMLGSAKQIFTEVEYLDIERNAEVKSEYHKGSIFAMSGASRNHNLIVTNTIAELRNFLKETFCEVYPSDMKVKIEKHNLYTYPDITIICDKPIFLDNRKDVILNPVLLIEVLSNSTEAYDRGKKFRFYRDIPTLREYILVSQNDRKIEKFVLNNTYFWSFMDTKEDDKFIFLDTIQMKLSLDEVYNKVVFENE